MTLENSFRQPEKIWDIDDRKKRFMLEKKMESWPKNFVAVIRLGCNVPKKYISRQNCESKVLCKTE